MAQQTLVPPSEQDELNLLLKSDMEDSLWTSLRSNIRAALFPEKLPPLVLTSRPVKVRDIWGNLKGIASSPRKLVLLLGGSFAQELLVAMALSVSLRAFDDHLRLPVLIVVIMLAATLGGVSPTPGGLGVVEAGMILGLTAAGVSEADATAAVFIQRLFTSYLPPIWGWATLVWLRRRDYL